MCFADIFSATFAAWPGIWLIDLLRYLLAAGALTLILRFASKRWLQGRQVRIRTVAPGQQRREFLWSMLTVVIFSLLGTVVLLAYNLGFSRLYFDVADYGWAWLPISLVVLVVLHDTWFYWTHRLMHSRALFRWTHRTHHLSMAPTAWAAYSFSPAEAIVQASFLPVALLVVPAHPAVLFIWVAWMVIRNVMGHCGTELLPRRWLAGWWGRWMTTTLHHEMHHAYGHGNYSLYFLWWDRWFGTEHPDYQQRLRALHAQPDRGILGQPGLGATRGAHGSEEPLGNGLRAEGP